MLRTLLLLGATSQSAALRVGVSRRGLLQQTAALSVLPATYASAEEGARA